MKLLLNLVQKDFKRNKVITSALAVFLILSVLLMAGGMWVAGTMISSLSGLNEAAATPHYLQMHKGTYDREAFQEFVESKDYIIDALVVDMLNISNANIIHNGETLEKVLMDNGFVVQNEKFDFLLDMNNKIATVSDGQIGVSIYYKNELNIKLGDTITVRKGDFYKEMVVSTFIRDALMNAPLTSSKRFLVSERDHEEISLNMGEWEYCFEFLLAEGASSAVLQKDYIDAGMPSNGVAITGSLMTMMNGISYGLIAFMIMAISILLIMIAILCLSYIIRATLAEENYTIGEMKAIGFSGKAIQKLYQIKYIILVAIAAFIGYFAAIPFGNFFSSSVIMYCGHGSSGWMKWVFALIGVIVLSLIVILKCRRIIRKNLKSTVIELMRGKESKKSEGHYSLPSRGMKFRNLVVALGELKCKWKQYVVIFLVFVFSSFLILLPMNMRSTIENPSFITYMGVAECDIRIDIQYSENLAEQKDNITAYLESDAEIEKYAIYKNGYVQFKNKENQFEYIRVESGDSSQFPLEYLEGRMPSNEEMALSYLNAKELDKKIGDSISVVYAGEELEFTVSGIYQDITYGGKTAKANIDFQESDTEVYIIYLDVAKGVSIEQKTDELRAILGSSGKITPVTEFVSQTLGGITENMKLVEGIAIAISLLLTMLITVMVLQLIMAKEHSAIAIKKAIGFSNRDIQFQLGLRIFIIQVIAIIIGTVLANFLGEVIFSLMLSSMGVAKITLLVNPVSAYVVCPLVQMSIVLVTTILATRVVKKYHIRNQIME